MKKKKNKIFVLSVMNIYLTEKAHDIRRRMEADRKKVDKRLTIGMTKKEVQALRKMLDKVLYNVADP